MANSSWCTVGRERISSNEITFLGDGLASRLKEDHQGHGQTQPRCGRGHERPEGDQDSPADRHVAEGRPHKGQGRVRGKEPDGLLRLFFPSREAGSQSGIFGNFRAVRGTIQKRTQPHGRLFLSLEGEKST